MQPTFQFRPPIQPMFDGPAVDPGQDVPRLTKQLAAIYGLMQDGAWRTVDEICRHFHGQYPATSVSANLRNLRKKKFGCYQVERKRIADGLWAFRVVK